MVIEIVLFFMHQIRFKHKAFSSREFSPSRLGLIYADFILSYEFRSTSIQKKKTWFPGYDTKLHLIERRHFWRMGRAEHEFITPMFTVPHPWVQ